jgi:hypothetical protein
MMEGERETSEVEFEFTATVLGRYVNRVEKAPP